MQTQLMWEKNIAAATNVNKAGLHDVLRMSTWYDATGNKAVRPHGVRWIER